MNDLITEIEEALATNLIGSDAEMMYRDVLETALAELKQQQKENWLALQESLNRARRAE